jgi:thioredoxin-related protein
MKKITAAIFMLVTMLTTAFTLSDPLPIGAALPMADTKLQDVSGNLVMMKEVKKDNGLLVMFSCNTCPFVIKNQERTVAVCNWAQKMNIGVVVLNSNEAQRNDEDSFEAMQNYAKEQKYNWNYAVDANNAVADAFGANRTPECFLFDKDLKLVYHGAIDDNASDASNVTRNHLQEAINELAAGKTITQNSSRSVGCTIKRKG